MNWSSLKEMMMFLLVCDFESDAWSNGDKFCLLSFLIFGAWYRLVVIGESSAGRYSILHRFTCKQTENGKLENSFDLEFPILLKRALPSSYFAIYVLSLTF